MIQRTLSIAFKLVPALAALSPFAIAQSELYLKPSTTYEGSSQTSTVQVGFGTSLSLSGSTLVVGRIFEHSDSVGIDGDEINQNMLRAGAAYVFMRVGSTWEQQAYVKASNTDAEDQFGTCVAISGDTMVITAPGERSTAFGIDGDQNDNSNNAFNGGAAYVFDRTGTTWTQQAYLKRPHSAAGAFGLSAAIDGDTVVVGAGNLACIFVRTGTTWVQQACVGATNTESGDDFATALALDGDTLVVGSIDDDSASPGVNGDDTNNNLTNSGAAFVFRRTGTVWNREAYLKAASPDLFDFFGDSVSISGDTILVCAPEEDGSATTVNGDETDDNWFESGAGYVFVRSGTTWNQEAYLKVANSDRFDHLGTAGVVSGNRILISAADEDNGIGCINGDSSVDGTDSAGAAYVFERTGTTWVETDYLKPLSIHFRDYFGKAVALEGNVAFVSSGHEDSDAEGVNGDQWNDNASGAGAVHGFNLAALPIPLPDHCSGDGGDQLGCTNCPCMNNAPPGTVGGCLNSIGASARLHACGNTSVSLPAGTFDDLGFYVTDVPASTFCILLSGGAVAPNNMANPCFGQNSGAQAAAFDGLRCAIFGTRRHGGRSSNPAGHVGPSYTSFAPGQPWGGHFNPQAGIAQAGAGFVSGETRFFQVIHREDALLSCMRGLNTSQAVEVTFTP